MEKRKILVLLWERKKHERRFMKSFDCEDNNSWIWDENEFEVKGTERAFLGVSGGEHTDEGATISYVTPGSSAVKIGILENDIVTSFNGQTVSDFGQLSDAIAQTSPGDAVAVSVLRDGESISLDGDIGKKEIPSCDDMIFKFDDLGGFDFDFDSEDFDEEEFEQSMQELREQLHEKLGHIEDLGEMEFDFDFSDTPRSSKSMTVIVLVEELSEEECNRVNENAEVKISPDNTLELEEVNFYPNPNDGIFNLEFEALEEGDMTLNIYDQNGKTVYKEMLAEFEGDYRNRIDISNRSNGAYYLQIIQNGKTFNKKILKQ